jgi:S1-C subfamily serine protease
MDALPGLRHRTRLELLGHMSWIGAIAKRVDDERSSLFGACFALFDRQWFATADHVVELAHSRDVADLHIIGPELPPVPVVAVHRHPSHDLAILHAPHTAPITPYARITNPIEGDAVHLRAWRRGGWDELDARVTGHGQIKDQQFRGLRRYSGKVFTFDAVAGPGFSGSPVVTAAGDVIGVVSGGTAGGATQGLAVDLSEALPEMTNNLDGGVPDGR